MLLSSRNWEIHNWGKSMYGGWYADYFDKNKGEWNGIGGRTLEELCNKLAISKTALKRDCIRVDNRI